MKEYPVAIITGASRGIGKACAIGLSQKGYRTVLVARTAAKLREAANEIQKQQPKDDDLTPVVYPLDVTDFLKVQQFVQEIMDKLKRIDLLINNAGITIQGTLDISISDFDHLYHSNLRAPFSLLKAVVPIMKKQKGGHIFNIASRSGKIGLSGKGGYVSTKFGLVGLGESLYRELAEEGIKVTSICPSWVNTDMAQQAGAPLAREEMIQPEDIMKTIQWVLDLSSNTCVKEVVIECRKSIV